MFRHIFSKNELSAMYKGSKRSRTERYEHFTQDSCLFSYFEDRFLRSYEPFCMGALAK